MLYYGSTCRQSFLSLDLYTGRTVSNRIVKSLLVITDGEANYRDKTAVFMITFTNVDD